MHRYSSLCDDHYINLNLSTEMELSTQRETVLSFFERVQKRYPRMQNFYCRDKRDFVLEEEKDGSRYRWCSTEARRICSGQVNPDSVEAALEQHQLVLELAPYMLSVSPLDCEALDLLFGFDFTCRGNHSQIVSEALGVNPALEGLAEVAGGRVVTCEPAMTLVLDEACRLQCRVSLETRTTPYHLRTGEFPEEQLSVYVSARRLGSLPAEMTYVDALSELARVCQEVVEGHTIEHVLRPLAQAISLQ